MVKFTSIISSVAIALTISFILYDQRDVSGESYGGQSRAEARMYRSGGFSGPPAASGFTGYKTQIGSGEMEFTDPL